MSQKPNNTALLIFSRTTAAEAAVKKLYPCGKKRNLKITRRLIQHVNSTAKATGLPYFIWDETVQVGDSFGERLSNAMEALFCKGFEQIIVVGNDSLNLTAADILKAADETAENRIVLIPSLKGGVSLIGINKGDFYKARLDAIPWQTEDVFAELQLYATQNEASSVCFAPIDDVNNLSDLKKAIKSLSSLSRLKKYLVNITAEHLHSQIHKTVFYFRTSVLHQGLRAPPLFTASF